MSRFGRIFLGLPAFNEEIALPRLLARAEALIAATALPLTVVVYNDGSLDATPAIAREWQSRLPLVLIDCPENKGLGTGLRNLVGYAVEHGTADDVLVVMDCDDTHDPDQILMMLDKLDAGADVVIASRYARGATVKGVPPLRRVTALGALVLCKVLVPVAHVRDYTCGYRAYRFGALKRAAAAYGDRLVTEAGFACMVELLLKLAALGTRFAEIPLRLRYDLKPGESKMAVGGNTVRTLKLLFAMRRHARSGALAQRR
jgi:dolichol-phosphate mannosyltransferase